METITKTAIHSHPKNGCIYRILEGSITEIFYENITKHKNE